MKKQFTLLTLLIFQLASLNCTNQGAFEAKQNKIQTPPFSRMNQLLTRSSHLLNQLNQNAGSASESGTLRELSQSLSELDALQSATLTLYESNIRTLENQLDDLDCVDEDHEDFADLSSSRRTECRRIQKDLSDNFEQRNKFMSRFGNGISALSTLSEQAENLQNGEFNPLGAIETASSIHKLVETVRAWR